MTSQVITNVENNFTKGLVTEFTGLNFPENAATDCNNCEFTLIGDVNRRLGINTETNGTNNVVSRTNKAISTYKWNNVSGDGLTQIVVEQIGDTLYFYKSSSATTTSPLSTQLLASTVLITTFLASGAMSFDSTIECQYADGNGNLFVYHPSCDPFYCVNVANVITATVIDVQIRDFQGDVDGLAVNLRPTTLSDAHLYNLTNQGWTQGAAWFATSSTVYDGSAAEGLGPRVFTVAAGLTVTLGDTVSGGSIFSVGGVYTYQNYFISFVGNVTAYAGTTLTINVTYVNSAFSGSQTFPRSSYLSQGWTINPTNHGYISTWNTAVGGYPSNADVWWYFKNSSGVFAPGTTISNITLNTGNAPRGHYLLSAFNQQRKIASAISTITNITTTVRPRTGTWFQGRVWYTGCDASQPASGTANAFSWTEQIYFSQVINDVSQFGNCFQTNDPTSEILFDLLPTDGGVIQIQGCGSIYKLFPIQNGVLVFAANGVWFITGSSGIGFAANDYTITKLSAIRSISSTSFVDVNGLPFFWNEEGIYSVEATKGGGLEVNPITVGTILSFYNEIPLSSKQYVRGAYHPIDYTIQWVYRDTEASDVTGRYTYNKILNLNTYNKAFFPYTVDTSTSSINGIIYVSSPGGSTAPDPVLKYITSSGSNISFGDEHDTTYKDWGSIDYSSYFVTGYKLHGQGQRRFQIPYIYIFSRADAPTSYYIQGLWDYATSGNSGRWSVAQLVNNWSPNFGMIFRRHKIRGQGLVLQIKVSSLSGQPFDIMGWSAFESQNTGV